MTTRTVSISRMGHRGDGVAGEVFIARALPGETVEVEGDGAHPTLARVIEPSPERIAPFCRHFGVCGGCSIQHWAREPYLAWKRQLVVDALAQAGLETTVHETIDAHGAGRRRALFHAGRQQGEWRVGFMAARSHVIVPIEACPILSPEMAGALPAARALAGKLAHLGKPLDIVVTATIDGLDVDLRGTGRLAESDTRGLISAAGALGLARLSNHGALVFQRTPPRVEIDGIAVGLPPGGFLQATAAGEKALAKLVLSAIDAKARRVADLFCGVGPFALGLARRARVFAADQDAKAIVALLAAARATPGLKPVEAEARDLFRRPLGPPELKGFDAVVFDPARAGAEAQAHALARSSVPRVVAVSCNPATFARDAAILTAGGFRLLEATPVDQFRHSAHIEIVAVLAR